MQRSENPQNVTCECKEKGVQAIGDCCLERREKEGVFEKSWKDGTQHPIKNLWSKQLKLLLAGEGWSPFCAHKLRADGYMLIHTPIL